MGIYFQWERKLIGVQYRPPILIDQGNADTFLTEQLKPETLQSAAIEAKADLTLRIQPGYDHSYFFIQTFIDEHLEFHAQYLKDE